MIDTAGFDDTDDEDETLLDGMMDTLTNEIEYANTILLLLDSQKKRFDGKSIIMNVIWLFMATIMSNYLIITLKCS